MQTKNVNIVYDCPEKWNYEENDKKMNTNMPFQNSISNNNNIQTSEMMDSISKINSQEVKTESKISIKVLNNNTNNQNLQNLPAEIVSSKLNSNSKFMIGNCENNLSEKRLLRSYSVYSNKTVENSRIKTKIIKSIDDKPRLSLPNKKLQDSLNTTVDDSNFVVTNGLASANKNPVTNIKLEEEPKKACINVNSIKKKRHNIDFSLNPSLAKRHRPNESVHSSATGPVSHHHHHQARFSLRAKSVAEK